MTIPVGAVPIPEVVVALSEGREVRAVWRNELGGVTFQISSRPDGAAGTEYVKTGPGDFAAEALRLKWARPYVTVPVVLGIGADWLHTAGLPGWSAVDPRWMAEPAVAARAIGAGLRGLHDALPVASCPFDWSVPTRLAGIRPEARSALAQPPPVDRLVVCHGDACAPNTLINAQGHCCGHVDLGSLGVADRWADLAVATMSLAWNFTTPTPVQSWGLPLAGRLRGMRRSGAIGPAADEKTLQSELLEAYGIAEDALRIDYYRRLWAAPEMDGG